MLYNIFKLTIGGIFVSGKDFLPYVDIGDDIIATDDDGDGVFDDVHHVTHGSGGVLHYDGDGDGIYDDSILGVPINSHDGVSRQSEEEEEAEKSVSFDLGKYFPRKKLIKGFFLVLGGLLAFSVLSEVILVIIGIFARIF